MIHLKKITVSFFIVIVLISGVFLHLRQVKENISSSLIRMHIIANSNSPSDQQVKLKIRDRLFEAYSFETDSLSKEKEFIRANLKNITSDVNKWLKEEGFEYTARAYLASGSFPTKEYGNLSLPKGEYTAFRVVLGDGKGENWWCVMFPPLCFADSSVGEIDEKGGKYLKQALSEEEYSLVTGGNTKIKFKLLEWLN